MIYLKLFTYFHIFLSIFSQALQMYGSSSLGYYYINVYIGSPPQLQTLILDTGSWLTAFPCNECNDKCGVHYDNQFDLKISNSSRIIACGESFSRFHCNNCGNNSTCVYGIHYSEGSSLEGFFFEDVLVLDENKSQINDKYLFGCTTKETHLFTSQNADGIMGLGVNSDGEYTMPNIIDYFYKNKETNGLKFSMCVSNVEGGFFSMGLRNLEKHVSDSQTYIVPISRSSGQYNINVYSMKIGNTALDLSHKDFDYEQGTFVDSGTTLFYAHHKIYTQIVEHFGQFCYYSSKCQAVQHVTKCFEYVPKKFKSQQEFFDIFPKIEFQLDDGFIFEWFPQDYLYKVGKHQLYCLPFEKIEGKVVFGAIIMRNYDIEFDRGTRKLSFTRSNCTKDWDPNLNPKHRNKNILQEISEPRILEVMENTNITNNTDAIILNNGSLELNNANDTSNTTDKKEEDLEISNKMILGICVILIVAILVTISLCVVYIRKKRNASELSKMIPKQKNSSEQLPRSEYQKPLENSLPNQVSNPNPLQGGPNQKDIYQIEENDISNSIDMNYEINMDINNNPGMHFSAVNFENIDSRKKASIGQKESAI